MTSILVISNMYPPHHYGGYELSCRDVMERLKQRGHRVTVLTTKMRVRGVVDGPEERSAGVLRDLDFYWHDHDLVSPPLHRRIAIERANQARLSAALGAASPDVVSVWNMGAMSLGLLTTLVRSGVPTVYAVCDDWLDYGPRVDPWMRLFLGRPRAARLVEALTGLPTSIPDLGEAGTFCFVSARTRKWAEERTPWQFPDSTVVYSGIDPADFPLSDGAKAGRPWNWRLLYVGRIEERKGVETAIRALAHLPSEATLEIVGRGDDRYLVRLQALVSEEGAVGRVRFDDVARSALRERYASADALLFPSMWEEPFGLVPVEAMACGTPVVATGNGGSREFLANEVNCLLFPAGKASALADAVCRLANDGRLRRAVAAGGIATAKELNIDRLADVLEDWHVAAADRSSDRRPAHRAPLPSA
jgi:glycosyltransferase involved in cell wall biosynthesis